MNTKGFTLIELMIVVAIIAFLSTLAIPQYFKYQARARQAEVSMMLASLHTAQQAYFLQHNKYSTVLSGENGIGWKPQGYKGGGEQENFYYTYGFNTGGAQEGVHYFTGKLGAEPSALGETYAEENRFLAKAAGDVTRNNKIDVWQIDEARQITQIQNGID